MSAVAIAVVGGVATIGSALINSSAAGDAANAQIQAANTASQTELQMFNQTRANEAPYVAAGNNALATLLQGLGLTQPSAATPGTPANGGYGGQVGSVYIPGVGNVNLGGTTGTAGVPAATAGGNIANGSLTAPFNYQASPGYAYEVGQTMNAVQNGATGHAGLNSGDTLMALQQNAQGLASTDYTNQANLNMAQKNQLYQMLQTVAGSGQNAAANLGSLGSQTASQIGSNTIGAGNAASAGINAQASSLTNLLNNQSFLNGVGGMFSGGGYSGGNYSGWASNPAVQPGVNPSYGSVLT